MQMLKYFLNSVVFCFIVINLSAQVSGSSVGSSDSIIEGSIDDLQVSPIRLPALQDIGGTPFFSNDYKLASIERKNDITVTNIPVKFNIYNNAIMVMKDGQEMKLESFYQVSYDDIANDGSPKHYVFAQGYPSIDNHTENSVYRIISSGAKVQLLKYLSQKIEEVPTLGDYSRREIVTTEQLYIYIPGGEIKKIKAVRKDLTEALPSMASKIEEIIVANNFKLKSEAEIAFVIDALNNP